MIFKLAALFWITASAAAQTALADVPPPGQVFIRNIAYGGNGCPQGSVSQLMSPDATAFTLLLDEYIAEMGPQVPRRDNRKSCQLAIDLIVPAGWSFSVATFDYRGYANLDP